MKEIIFIGGIHGSGKGRICETLKVETNLIHLTASEVIKWSELSKKEDKKVKNIHETQNRLIINLKKIIQDNKLYLLDGHYCLLNKNGIPEKIPIQTFKEINPLKLILVIAEPIIIKERLENRDSKTYSIELVEEFQNLEINYAKEVSQVLEIPFIIINSEQFEINKLLNFLK